MASQWEIAVANTSPAHWWRLGERGGEEIKDLTGGLHLPRYHGTPDWGSVGLIGADEGGGMSLVNTVGFSRHGSPISAKHSAATSGDQLTVGFWLNVKAGPAANHVWLINSYNNTLSRGWIVRVNTSGQIQFGWGTGTTGLLYNTALDAVGKHLWQFAVDGSHLVVYKDGARVQESSITFAGRGTANSTNFSFAIGAGDNVFSAPNSMDGVLDEVIVWPRVITDQEVTSLFSGSMEMPDHASRLELLPKHITSDPNVIAVMEAMGWEHLRYDNAWQDLFEQLFIQTATWGLRYWEQALQLPVEPTDQTLEQRRTVAMTAVQAKDAVSGEDFNAALAAISTQYGLQMDWNTSTLNVAINYNPNDFTEAQLETILASLTPAHLSYNIIYEAFIAGVSTAGDLI
jgi:uncharacterized protein YmfQ (DUF2313 family)